MFIFAGLVSNLYSENSTFLDGKGLITNYMVVK